MKGIAHQTNKIITMVFESFDFYSNWLKNHQTTDIISVSAYISIRNTTCYVVTYRENKKIQNFSKYSKTKIETDDIPIKKKEIKTYIIQNKEDKEMYISKNTAFIRKELKEQYDEFYNDNGRLEIFFNNMFDY